MKFKAVFFDRDNTLTYYNPEKVDWQNEIISSWSGKPLELPYDKTMALFNLAAEGRKPWYKNLEDEKAFFRRYYQYLLIGEGVEDRIEERQICSSRNCGATMTGFFSLKALRCWITSADVA